ncbi:hypothetical protein GGS23DRAFT_442179 [Durotheca rogersii]|uniref:uncharacterized protein n=1 Tax=Durotheca rogersii TaxID=419775 RepID=UPI00221F3949|nr:uncharacterized protein GGS23DRAFT_442179 [Durotheca rogersii]KAI5855611.1 hypothetical protein GGS23DRAFT_442179 [Durotheca rogersii]
MPSMENNPGLNHVACRALPQLPVTVIAAAYDGRDGLEGELRFHVITGGYKYLCNAGDVGLPEDEEGVYILYQDRALQVAGPMCDQRRCCASHVCACYDASATLPLTTITTTMMHNWTTAEHQQYHRQRLLVAKGDRLLAQHRHRQLRARLAGRIGRIGSVAYGKKTASLLPPRGPCRACLANWTCVQAAAEAARDLGLLLLRHPRPLTRTGLLGRRGFHFDGALALAEGRCDDVGHGHGHGYSYGHQEWMGRHGAGVGRGNEGRPRAMTCSPLVFEWMRDAWTGFVAEGEFQTRASRVMTLAEVSREERQEINAGRSRGDEEKEDEEDADINDWENDWEWDTLDLLCKPEKPRSDTWTEMEMETFSTATTLAESGRKDDDDFDFIDDLINEEFPKLRKDNMTTTDAETTTSNLSTGAKVRAPDVPVILVSLPEEEQPQKRDNTVRNEHDNSEEEGGGGGGDDPALPVPVIIPPKNMAVARDLSLCAAREESERSTAAMDADVEIETDMLRSQAWDIIQRPSCAELEEAFAPDSSSTGTAILV